ncbi:hypothetical protein C8Q80DRAFT_928604 [Daedaleopsis nitida]|nr:hypothetical protein C8Q80DRAFT_928604 [Daedaleopsis nitida]
MGASRLLSLLLFIRPSSAARGAPPFSSGARVHPYSSGPLESTAAPRGTVDCSLLTAAQSFLAQASSWPSGLVPALRREANVRRNSNVDRSSSIVRLVPLELCTIAWMYHTICFGHEYTRSLHCKLLYHLKVLSRTDEPTES